MARKQKKEEKNSEEFLQQSEEVLDDKENLQSLQEELTMYRELTALSDDKIFKMRLLEILRRILETMEKQNNLNEEHNKLLEDLFEDEKEE